MKCGMEKGLRVLGWWPRVGRVSLRSVSAFQCPGPSNSHLTTSKPPASNISHQSRLPPLRLFSSSDDEYGREVSEAEYEEVSEETLESLTESLEAFADFLPVTPEFDVTYSQGVLTAVISDDFGTYVINKQTPNKQIWLSSPVSGPKRYDFLHGRWLYGREDETLHQVVERELRDHFHQHADKISLEDCAYSGSD